MIVTFMVSTTIMKKTTYTWFKYPEIQVHVGNQTNRHAVFVSFVLKKHYVSINLHASINLKGWKNVFTS